VKAKLIKARLQLASDAVVPRLFRVVLEPPGHTRSALLRGRRLAVGVDGAHLFAPFSTLQECLVLSRISCEPMARGSVLEIRLTHCVPIFP
jgi:hypothetical protein